MAGTLADNPFAHLSGLFFTARTDPEIRATPGGAMQYVWQGINNEFLSRGEPLPPGAFQAVNELWRWSSSVVAADNALARSLRNFDATGRDQALDASHIVDSINARPLGERPEGSQFSVVYRTVYSVGGETFTDTFQHDFGYNLPATAAGLMAQIESAAALQVADYGYDWEGVAVPISIRAY